VSCRVTPLFAAALVLTACVGSIEGTPGAQPSAANGDPVNSTRGDAGTTGGAGSSAAAPQARDVNRVDLHRLNNTEYDNTVRDLLGVSSSPAASFIGDEKAHGFDNIAAALGMTDAQYEQYWTAADELVEATMADATLRARILTCEPGSADPSQCTGEIIRRFGLRAFRRPLAKDDVEPLAALAADARAQGDSFEQSIALVAKAMLSAPRFLYRVELDPQPNAAEAHALDPYELATRLSYLVWSTMPDDTLFELAADGELSSDKVLARELDRMLEDPRAEAFVDSFAGQWLGLRDLQNHTVEKSVYTQWSEPLREAMVREGLLYFDEFFRGERSLDEFFSASLHFPNETLAELYGIADVRGDEPKRIDTALSDRRGFMGLASFLTLTSFSYRTAPTLRGKWVLENLLCSPVAPPPANVPQLDDSAAKGDIESLNVRERLAEHRTNPACAGCHNILDPIGLGLEHFDAIGRYRASYGSAETIDASGMLPSGESFDGLIELSTLLADDTRLADCASSKLLTYALSRAPVKSDEPYLAEIRTASSADGKNLRSLLSAIVQSDLFRMRRGEPESP
jgi:hypothetical protein